MCIRDRDDLSEATSLLFELPPDRLEDSEVLALRIALARRKGHEARARDLWRQLKSQAPQHPLCENGEMPDLSPED